MEAAAIIIPIVITLVVVVATVIPAIIIFKKVMGGQAQNSRLQAQGESAQAQVMGIQETGVRLNDRPQVQLTLNVQRAGQAPYQVQCTAIISALIIPRVQPGMMVPVKVDRANPQTVALDMQALQGVPAAGGMAGGMMGAMGVNPNVAAAAANPYAAHAAGQAQAAAAGAHAAQAAAAAQMNFQQQAAAGGYNPQQAQAAAYANNPMAGVNPHGMSQDQLMALANQAAAMPPAGGAILQCAQCGNPYASANPRCPNCGAAKPG